MIASSLSALLLPHCSREARLARSGVVALRRVGSRACLAATAVRGASFIHAGAPLLEGQQDCERRKESVQADPGGRVVAGVVRLPSGSQCSKRFESPGEFRSIRHVETCGRAAAHRNRCGQATGHRARRGGGDTGENRACERARAGKSHRQERGRSANLARPTNKRGGACTGENLALPGWAVHRRHPALSGCADEAVRNSCVRGKER